MTRHRMSPVWLRDLATVSRRLASLLSLSILPLYPLKVSGEGLVPGRDILRVIAGHEPRLLLPGELLRHHRVPVRHFVQLLPVVSILEAGLNLLKALLLFGLGNVLTQYLVPVSVPDQVLGDLMLLDLLGQGLVLEHAPVLADLRHEPSSWHRLLGPPIHGKS